MLTTISSDRGSDGGSIENPEYYREREEGERERGYGGIYARGRYLLRRPPTDGRDEFAPRCPRRGATTPTQGSRVSGTAAGMPAPHFDSSPRVEDTFTHGRPLGPYLPTVVVAESSRSSFHLLRCLLAVSRRVHALPRADFIPVPIATEVLSGAV